MKDYTNNIFIPITNPRIGEDLGEMILDEFSVDISTLDYNESEKGWEVTLVWLDDDLEEVKDSSQELLNAINYDLTDCSYINVDNKKYVWNEANDEEVPTDPEEKLLHDLGIAYRVGGDNSFKVNSNSAVITTDEEYWVGKVKLTGAEERAGEVKQISQDMFNRIKKASESNFTEESKGLIMKRSELKNIIKEMLVEEGFLDTVKKGIKKIKEFNEPIRWAEDPDPEDMRTDEERKQWIQDNLDNYWNLTKLPTAKAGEIINDWDFPALHDAAEEIALNDPNFDVDEWNDRLNFMSAMVI
jgi:ribosomal protein S8